MRIKPYGKKFSFWVNRCAECDDLMDITLRKVGKHVCRKCTQKYQEMKRAHKSDKAKTVLTESSRLAMAKLDKFFGGIN